MALHIQRIRAFFQPPIARPAVEEIDSGRLEMKTCREVGGSHGSALKAKVHGVKLAKPVTEQGVSGRPDRHFGESPGTGVQAARFGPSPLRT